MSAMKTIASWLVATAACVVTAAQAQGYPARPVHLLHGFAPGGQGDTIARILATEMARGLGGPVIVEAKPGADSNIASDAVAKSAPDGYTLLLATGAVPISAALYKSLPYDTVQDFQWISTAVLFSYVLSTRADGRYPSLPALLQAAKAKPQAVSFGAGGIGARLAAEMLASVAGAKLLSVPYKGDAPALVGLLGGDTDFVVTPATIAMPHIKGGKLKALAITGARRWSGLPDVPTVAEQGFGGFDVRSWIGLAAPAGTPAPVVARLREELVKALNAPEVRSKLEGFGFELQASSGDEMRRRVVSEIAQWRKIAAAAGIPNLP